MLNEAKIPKLYAKHSPYVDYKDNKNQDKKYDNCNYFTVDFTILNPGIFYTSCNIKKEWIVLYEMLQSILAEKDCICCVARIRYLSTVSNVPSSCSGQTTDDDKKFF